ncbi:MAG: AAA family ATPase, partial [Planctomycetota bacterium]
MAQVDLKQLISKFNETCRKTLEGATGLCMSRSHFNIEIEHWLFKILEIPGTDLEILIRQYDIDPSRLVGDITKSLDGFKTGNARAPGLSPDLVKLAKEGWLIGSVDFNEGRLRSGHLVAAMLSDESLSRIANGTSEEFKKISIDNLKAGFHAILKDSVETGQGGAIATSGPVSSGQSTVGQAGGETPSLDQFTIDLTEKAKSGQIDPVLGRDPEIRQITDILTRRRQNNPILTGEAGVGKTAVVEGFALRIAKGDVPPALKNVSVRSLDLALLQAGAGVKGEFENRLKSVINEVKSSPTPIIMFIDEAHTMIGAGGQAGQGDAANLLKPALARGELRTIAATTWSEYKKYFEKDPALARRFQVIKVEEPSEKSAIEMMRGITSTLEQHHGVRVMNEAIVDSVRLSSRYISGRQLPDKSVSLLDTTCARIGLSQASTPAPVEDCQRRIDSLKVAIDVMNRESEVGVDHSEDLEISRQQLADTEKEYADLNQRWQNELELVNQINTINEKLTGINGKSDPDHSESDADSDVDSQQTANETSPTDEDTSTNEDTSTDEDTSTNESPDKAALVAQLTELKNELLDIQGTNPLV